MRSSYLFAWNVYLNGFKAILYCYGLNKGRYAQHMSALQVLGDYTGKTVLNLGSGHSVWPHILALKATVVVLDLDRESVKWQKKKNRRLLPICASIAHLPFRSGSFRVITCISTIEHCPEDVKGMAEVRRVLETTGTQVQVIPTSKRATTGDKLSWSAR